MCQSFGIASIECQSSCDSSISLGEVREAGGMHLRRKGGSDATAYQSNQLREANLLPKRRIETVHAACRISSSLNRDLG